MWAGQGVTLTRAMPAAELVGSLVAETQNLLSCKPANRVSDRQDGVNWEMVISTVGQVVVSAARAASSLAAMPVMVSSVR